LALFGLCAGFFIPYASLLCLLIAVILAVIGLKSQRKALSIIALVISIISFCLLAGLGWWFWPAPEYSTGMSELGKSLWNLFQSIIQLIKTILKIP
jgi:threonine/homoserine/homoserine lactone efflux protein